MTLTLGAPVSPLIRVRALCLAFAAAASLGGLLTRSTAAQTLDTATVVVTFTTTVSLSNLHPGITEVKLQCMVTGGKVYGGHVQRAGTGHAVVRGAVNATLSVSIPVPLDVRTATPVGTQSDYTCGPVTVVSGTVYYLSRASDTDPRFKVDADPVRGGKITW